MNTLTKTITLLICLSAAVAWAGPEHPNHDGHEKKEWTDHNDSDPGIKKARAVTGMQIKGQTATRESVSPELSKIVVLCANEQEKQFEKEWKQYVDKHELKGPELNETIAFVSKEAAQKRKSEGKIKSAQDQEAWAQKRSEFMREVADKALNPAR